MRVAITGARGFVGGAVTRLLAGAGWDVIPLDLHTDAPADHTAGIPITRFDITTGPLPATLLNGPVDAVVHVAAFVSDTGPLALARRVNVNGTENVVASFPGARFVHVSSCSVYDPHHPQHNAAESEAPAPGDIRWTNAYGRTKSEAEARLRVLRPDAVVLRPHAVYGPGDTTLAPRLRDVARRGWIPMPHGGVQLHSITHVDNLAEACRLGCLPEAPAGTYNINDGDPIPLREGLIRMAGGDTTNPPSVVPVPKPVMMVLGTLMQASASARTRLTGRSVPPKLSRYSVEHLALERTFDTTAARERLGYRPMPTSLADA